MEQYIKKSILVAEIERRINEINLDTIEDWRYRLQREHDIKVMKNILSIIDTLEVKGVDFDEELVDYHNDNFIQRNDGTLLSEETGSELTWDDYECIAKHFFELGLKAQKGE